MSNTFKVGEIAILRVDMSESSYYEQFSGQECEVIGPLQMRTGYHWGLPAGKEERTSLKYRIRMPCGKILLAEPHELRKRPPPPNWNALAYSKPRDVQTTEQV